MARSLDSRKVREWQGRLARFERSRCSVTQFCQDEGVSVPSFYTWRKRLQQQAPARQDGRRKAMPFTPLRVVASPSITVRLPGGAQLEVPTADPDVLRLAIQTVIQVDAERLPGGEPC